MMEVLLYVAFSIGYFWIFVQKKPIRTGYLIVAVCCVAASLQSAYDGYSRIYCSPAASWPWLVWRVLIS